MFKFHDTTIDPNYKGACPFHGDKRIIETIDTLIKNYKIEQFVETGTAYADTLFFMGTNFQINCYSCEPDDTRYELSRVFCEDKDNIKIFKETSPNFFKNIKNRKSLFWLDAHGEWIGKNNDRYTFNPLREELKYIFDNFNESHIMIDDFKNPFGFRCGYDIIDGVELSYSYIKDLIPEGYHVYFPTYNDLNSSCMPWMTNSIVGWCLITKEEINLPFIRKI